LPELKIRALHILERHAAETQQSCDYHANQQEKRTKYGQAADQQKERKPSDCPQIYSRGAWARFEASRRIGHDIVHLDEKLASACG